MSTILKSVQQPYAAGPEWKAIYTCPVGKSAIIKSVIATLDGNSTDPSTTSLGITRAGLTTALATSIAVPVATAVNLNAGTLTLEANDVLVTKNNKYAITQQTNTAGFTGTLRNSASNGSSTIIALTSTGAWRSTDDGDTWTQTDTYTYNTAVILSYISTKWIAYISTTSVRVSTDDGLTWAAQVIVDGPILPTTVQDGGLLKVGSTFYGANNYDTVSTTDGLTWTRSSNGITLSSGLGPERFAFGNSIWVGIKLNSGTDFWTSTDLITWTLSAFATNVSRISFANGIFFAFGSSGTTFYTSTDGTSWTSRSLPSSFGLAALPVVYGNSTYVMVSETSSTQGYTSTDGFTWTARTLGSHARAGIAFGAGVFVYLRDGTGSATTEAYSSPDGITWTVRTLPSGSWSDITFGGTQFLAVTLSTVSANSANGTTWASPTLGTTGGRYVNYVNGEYVVTGTSGNGCRGSSSASVNTLFYLALASVSKPATDGTNLLVPITSSIATGFRIQYSVDNGTSWVHPVGAGVNIGSMTWTGTKFVAASNSPSTSAFVITSSDRISWTYSSVRSFSTTAIDQVISNGAGTVMSVNTTGIVGVSYDSGTTWAARLPSLDIGASGRILWAGSKFISNAGVNGVTISSTAAQNTWTVVSTSASDNTGDGFVHNGKLFTTGLRRSYDLDFTQKYGLAVTASLMEVF